MPTCRLTTGLAVEEVEDDTAEATDRADDEAAFAEADEMLADGDAQVYTVDVLSNVRFGGGR